jgi:hypothetical protein
VGLHDDTKRAALAMSFRRFHEAVSRLRYVAATIRARHGVKSVPLWSCTTNLACSGVNGPGSIPHAP